MTIRQAAPHGRKQKAHHRINRRQNPRHERRGAELSRINRELRNDDGKAENIEKHRQQNGVFRFLAGVFVHPHGGVS